MRLLVLLLISSMAFADTRGLSITASDGTPVGGYENSYALLIGVSDYRAGWPDLNSVPGELNQVSEALAEQGFDITRVDNPTERELERALDDFVDRYGYTRDNRLLFYFAGHGYTRLNNTRGYLVPADAPDPRRDDTAFVRKAYPMTKLLSLARTIESKHALFLFDSCFSGTIFKTRALPETPPLIDRLTSEPVRQFITAGDAGQEVPAQSVFTPAFIDAIKFGRGDLNGDGYVTGTELGMHLQAVVGNAGSQTPQYGKIQDYNLARGDYVFLASLTSPVPPVVTLPPKPSGSDFNLDDINSRAKQEQVLRTSWQNQQNAMQSAFNEVRNLDNQNVDPGLKISAWQRFQQAFNEDNPYSRDDDGMRREASQRLSKLRQEQKAREQQLASLSTKSGGALSSTGKACDVCPEMVLIPAGSFRMGDLNGGGSSAEQPVHRVDIEAFALGKYEVTFAEYDAFARASNRSLPSDQGWGRGSRPVIYVSWEDAQAYIEWLNNRTGLRFRLPSESEWEYAARAGTTTKYYWGNSPSGRHANGDEADGWPNDGIGKQTGPVGRLEPNAFGLYDMSGNVWEWVEDCWNGFYNGAPTDGTAWTRGDCDRRVLRGGSWLNGPQNLRSADRNWSSSDSRGYGPGFRLAQDL